MIGSRESRHPTCSSGASSERSSTARFPSLSSAVESKSVSSLLSGNPLPGTTTDQGLVLIGEMPTHAIGKAFKGCVEYKNTMLAPFKKTYTDEAAYEADVKTFMAEIFTRDVRIIGV